MQSSGAQQGVHPTAGRGVQADACHAWAASLLAAHSPQHHGRHFQAWAAPTCGSVLVLHIQVESEAECDTFMPPVDEQRFKLWSASAPQRDTPDGTRYSFLCCEHRAGASVGRGAACCACHACVRHVAAGLVEAYTVTLADWPSLPHYPRACCRHSRRAGGPAGAAAGGGQQA